TVTAEHSIIDEFWEAWTVDANGKIMVDRSADPTTPSWVASDVDRFSINRLRASNKSYLEVVSSRLSRSRGSKKLHGCRCAFHNAPAGAGTGAASLSFAPPPSGRFPGHCHDRRSGGQGTPRCRGC